MESNFDRTIFCAVDNVQNQLKKVTSDIKDIQSTLSDINSISEAELDREKQEEQRQSDESSRVDAETHRVQNESKRVDAETGRVLSEQTRVTAENNRKSKELIRQDAENIRITNENTRQDNEQVRQTNEKNRADAEVIRINNENTRVNNETERINNETTRINSETTRINNENTRIAAEEQREKVIADAKNTVKEAANVNVELDSTKINITNRKGETKSLELVDIDEHVTVTIKTKITDVTLSGKILNVFRNHGETPEQYTTNDQGIVTFSVTRGTYYEIHFPDVGVAQPINPIGYTATLPVRNVEVEYIQAESGHQEHVTIECQKAKVDDTKEIFPNINFTIQVDANAIQNCTTDAQGQYQFDIVWDKKYTVTFISQDGFYTTTPLVKQFTASLTNRTIKITYYTYKNGIFIVTDDGQEYTLEQFKAQNLDKTTAKMIAVQDKNLIANNSIIYASIEDLSTLNFPRMSWCTNNVLFSSIPEKGNDTSSQYYYDGNSATTAIINETNSKTLLVPAATYARTKYIVIDGNTMHGYLPSIGQFQIFQYNSIAIDEILKYIVGDNAKTVSRDFFDIYQFKWTSAQNGEPYVYYYGAGLGYCNKTDYNVVACFYAY